jgi:phospholipid-binding lipoprotein MlaA
MNHYISLSLLARPSYLGILALALAGGCTIRPDSTNAFLSEKENLSNHEGKNQNDDDSDDDNNDGNSDIKDPFEPVNRCIFAFNRSVDTLILRPLSYVYAHVFPTPVKKAFGNFTSNLSTPLDAFYHLAQGNGMDALNSLGSFLINTVFGFFGLFDVTKNDEIEIKKTNFNQTLKAWNINTGPYIVLPVLGGTTLRGSIGYAGDCLLDPWRIITDNKKIKVNKYHQQKHMYYGIRGMDVVRKRSELDESYSMLENDSIDFYVAVRSVVTQKEKTPNKKDK